MSMTVIRSVDPRSPAHRAGLRPGETLLEVNGQEFETYLMDRARSCANNCIFCFVDQMPPGMRKSLYFKDDDARLSFLMGNYLTLTNLSQREVERIIALRISPINVSVHTTDPELRSEMLKNKRAGEGIAIMRRFAQASITMNCQIVSCPGINDGPALDRTLLDLADMAPAVNSISVVPVGVTKYREGLYPLRPYAQEEAAALIDQVEAFAAAHKAGHGTSLVWCSDEFYLLAGRPLPQEDYYEEFTQLDNGVGMLRLLRQEFCRGLNLMEPEEMEGTTPFSIATGVSAAPFLTELIDLAREKCGKIEGTVYPIRNDFFGETITVAGLVTGGDLIAQLRGKPLGERLLIPQNMLRHGSPRTCSATGSGSFWTTCPWTTWSGSWGCRSRPWPRTGTSCWTPCAAWRSLPWSRCSCGRRRNTFNIDRSDEIGDRSLSYGDISPSFYLLFPISNEKGK